VTEATKLTASEKRAVKRREVAAAATDRLGLTKGGREPTLNPLDYKTTLVVALNYYNLVYDNKDKRRWFMSYVGKTKDFDALPDWKFKMVGTLIRLKQREQTLEDKELKYIEDSIASLRREAKFVVVDTNDGKQKTVAATVAKVVDKTDDIINAHLTEFNVMIDEFVVNDKEPTFADYLKSHQVPSAIAKQLPKFFERNTAEIAEAIEGNDKQLVEAYGFLKKTKLKKLLKVYEAIAEACQQAVVSNKVIRKPRAVKEKPATVVAKGVKYMPEFTELGLKSVPAPTLVNSKEVWIYNTKYKKLQVYRAPKDQTITVKGTTLINYDVANSSSKTIRKPEQIKELGGMTRKNFELAFNKLTTKEASVNGRINEDCILLKVW
jgi:hypothetical protein